MSNGQGDAEAVIKAAREGQETRVILVEHDGVSAPLLVRNVGNGASVVESIKTHLDQYRANPERRQGTAVLGDLESFIAHANRFKDPDSAIFVTGGSPGEEDSDAEPPTFQSVLDYHERVNVDAVGGPTRLNGPGEQQPLPRFGKHRGAYKPAFSAEWTAWTEKDGDPLTQANFAAFVEERAADVFDLDDRDGAAGDLAKWFAEKFGGKVAREGGPGAYFATCQTLLDLSEGLNVTVTDKVGEASKRDSGAVRITFESDVSTSVEVPSAFVIAIPVFEGGDLYQIPVRLKMALRTSGDTKRTEWTLSLYGVARTFRTAVDDAKVAIAGGTGLPVFTGAPE